MIYENVVWDIIVTLFPLVVIVKFSSSLIFPSGKITTSLLLRSFGWTMSHGVWIVATAYLLVDHVGLTTEELWIYLDNFVPKLAKFGVILAVLDILLLLLVRGGRKIWRRYVFDPDPSDVWDTGQRLVDYFEQAKFDESPLPVELSCRVKNYQMILKTKTVPVDVIVYLDQFENSVSEKLPPDLAEWVERFKKLPKSQRGRLLAFAYSYPEGC